MLDCAARLSFSLGLEVCGRRFLCGIKQSQVSALSVIAFAFRHVFFGVAVKTYTKVSSFIVGLGSLKILRIGLLSNASKVFVAVVASVAVNMVNILRRPDSGHKQDRAPMGVVFPACNRNFCIPIRLTPSRNIPRFSGSVVQNPGKLTSGWVVVKEAAKLLCGKIVSSHDALQMLIGQRPQAIRSRLGLRHFSKGI